MSLTIAYSLAARGIATTEKKLSVLASNINNADQAGYTRKIYQTNVLTSNGITTQMDGQVMQASVNKSLIKSIISQASGYAKSQTLADYLGSYSQSYGSTAEGSATLGSSFNALMTALQTLESEPAQSSSKAQAIASAQMMVSQLNSLSASVQVARTNVSHDIAASVDTINETLRTLEMLNAKIGAAGGTGDDLANLEDQRTLALQELSAEIGIQYFTDDQNQLRIYTSGGDMLLGSKAATLSYTDVGTASRSTVYPGGFSGIMLNGRDITPNVNSGALGALVELRDVTLPGEQEKLDELAHSLIDTVNGVLGGGTSYPPLTTVTGTRTMDAGDALSATGTLRVAIAAKDGTIEGYADLDLSSYATVQDLLDGLNGISGVSASLVDGKLNITSSDSTKGIALNPMDSDIGGVSATHYLGVNGMFSGSNASDIRISDYLLKDSNALPTGSLSSTTPLTIGSKGITSGDASIAEALVDALGAAQGFGAAGNFSARTMSISAYISAIVADAATQASTAKNTATTAGTAYTFLSERLASEAGVNIDEETANMVALQSSYEANATLLSTVRQMFESLLQSVQ